MSDLGFIKLGELARGFRGVSYTPEQLLEYSTESSYTLLRSNNISGGFLNFTKTQIVPAGVVSEEQVLSSGDIAVCMSNGSKALVGKSAAYKGIEGRYTVGAFCSVFRPCNTSDSSFLAHVFQSSSFRKHIDLILAGSAINNLRNRDVEEYKLIDFAPSERLKLAEILDVLDTQIRETETIIAKLQQVKQGLLHDLLTRGVDENGELRPSYEDAPELYKSSELGWIPKDWVVLELGSIASRSGGFIQTGPFGSQLHAHEYVDEGIPVVMPQDLCGEYIDGIKAAKITEERAQTLLKHRFEENDVVFSRRGDLSRCAAISFQVGWVCGTGCLLVRLPKTVMLSSYLSIIYKQQWIQKQVLGMAVGSTMANLNTSILSRLLVTKPNVDEQAEIMTRCSTLESRLKSEEVKLSKLNTLKSGLMDDLLTGKKRVTDLLKQQAN